MANLSIFLNLFNKLSGLSKKEQSAVVNKLIRVMVDEGVITEQDVKDSVKTFFEMYREIEKAVGQGKSYEEACSTISLKYPDFIKNITNLN